MRNTLIAALIAVLAFAATRYFTRPEITNYIMRKGSDTFTAYSERTGTFWEVKVSDSPGLACVTFHDAKKLRDHYWGLNLAGATKQLKKQ